jgi:hypothetical protein
MTDNPPFGMFKLCEDDSAWRVLIIGEFSERAPQPNGKLHNQPQPRFFLLESNVET